MRRLPFELLLAIRYLRPKRTFVSVITLISVLGVMLGVAVLIIVISVMSGFDRQMHDRLLGFNAHLKIEGRESTVRDHRSLVGSVRTQPGVAGAAPFVMGQVLVETQPSDGSAPRAIAPIIRGIDPAAEGSVSVLPSSIVSGTFDVRDNGILIGRNLAERLGIHVGDSLAIYSLRNLKQMRDAAQKGGQTEVILPDDYEVRGIFYVDYNEFDDFYVVCSLQRAQELYGLGDTVHGILVKLHNPYQADTIRDSIRRQIGTGYDIRTWAEENRVILGALVVEKNVMFYILFFIVVVAAFGITSVLITFVVQKTRDIGILKAIGATRGQVLWLFLSQSLVVGIAGVASGLSLGLLAVSYRNEFLRGMRHLTGRELFPAAIYNFQELPAIIDPTDVTIICAGSLLICLLAGLFPAWNAARLQPADALRHE